MLGDILPRLTFSYLPLPALPSLPYNVPLPGLMELKSNLGVNTEAEVVVHHVQRRPFSTIKDLSFQTNKPYIHQNIQTNHHI